MPKGRGSNEARRNRRTAGRNGGWQSGYRYQAGIERQLETRSWRPWWNTPKVSWWKRVLESLKKVGRSIEANVSPARATRRLENQIAEQRKKTLIFTNPDVKRAQTQVRRRT